VIEDNYRKNFIEKFRKRFEIDLENKMIDIYWFEIMEEKDKEIERLNKIIEKNKYSADELNEIERLNKGLDELEELCKTKYYEKNTTDIDSIAIAGNLYVYMYKKIKELKGSDKE